MSAKDAAAAPIDLAFEAARALLDCGISPETAMFILVDIVKIEARKAKDAAP